MRLSVQLYTLRTPMESDPWGTLAKVKEMGLNYVELAGLYGKSAEEVKAKLNELGLQVSASHVGLGDLESRYDEVVANHKTLGVKDIVIPWTSQEDWNANMADICSKTNSFGEKLAADGFQLSYHNHGHELIDGKLGEFFDNCDANNVKVQLDLGWVFYAGEDPVVWLKKFGSRLSSVHLKDMDMKEGSPDAIAGEGKIDWQPILAACNEIGVPFAAIEMDNPPGDAVESVKTCVDYFRARGVSE